MNHDIEQFRQQKDQFFGSSHQSPLTADQREAFEGLNYFPVNEALSFELELEKFEEQDEIQMQTSTGTIAPYIRWGKIQFDVDGESAELTVYAAVGGGGFFLPFRDATSGDETYGSGRYLEIDPLSGGRFLVDFNMAYNPYCAYNENWTCPIPPAENRLSVPIRAGEKTFTDH